MIEALDARALLNILSALSGPQHDMAGVRDLLREFLDNDDLWKLLLSRASIGRQQQENLEALNDLLEQYRTKR